MNRTPAQKNHAAITHSQEIQYKLEKGAEDELKCKDRKMATMKIDSHQQKPAKVIGRN